MIIYRSDRELATLAEAGRIAAEILDAVCARVAPGVTTGELEREACRLMEAHGVVSAFKTARTVAVGEVDELKQRLLAVGERCLAAAIEQVAQGKRVHDVSHAVQATAEAAGFSVVRDFVGHGIGRELHEEPKVPNYGRAGTGPPLGRGIVIAIEPMVNAGTCETRVLEDNWTVVTADGLPSVHFEHTVAVTRDGREVLTTCPKTM
jgi:methionyl aminopeptidase